MDKNRPPEELGSITRWVADLKKGDADAATPLWNRYAPTLVRVARQKLSGAAPSMSDEEDAVLSAFESFCRGAVEGEFDQLSDRMELWRLLVVITLRKSVNQIQNQQRLKRGGSHKIESLVDEVATFTERPDFVASAAEQYQRLLEALGDDQLREIALLRMDGFLNREIATRLGCTRQTVQRRLNLIRTFWENELAAD